MPEYNQMLNMTLGEVRRLALQNQFEEAKDDLLAFRGEAFVKLGDAVIPTEIMYAEYDGKNKQVIFFTDLRAQDDNQRLVVDVYIYDEIARMWAMGMEQTLEGRVSENPNHATVTLSLH